MVKTGAFRAVLAAALASGCAGAGAVDLAGLPDAPVALLQRPEAQALDRVDALGDLEKRQQGLATEGVARIEDLDAMLGGSPDLERRLQPYQGQLVLLDPRSGRTTPLENAPAGAQPIAWSADRRRLLLTGRWRDSLQLFVWDRATAVVDIATTGPAAHPSGCIGSDGRIVAGELLDARGRGGRLVQTPPGGGGLRPLTEGPRDYRPSCAPNEPRIAFVRIDPGGTPSVAVMELAPPGSARVVAQGLQPVFTPDGAWIVYTARTTKGPRLFRVRPDGSGRTPLGAATIDEGQPAVSPDGRYVAYVAVDADRRERLWVRRFDGSGDRPLLSSGDGSMPSW